MSYSFHNDCSGDAMKRVHGKSSDPTPTTPPPSTLEPPPCCSLTCPSQPLHARQIYV
jgi:hypothetical protein